MKYSILAVTFVLLIQSLGAQTVIDITTPTSVTLPESEAKTGQVAFTFTVSASPPSTCDFTYEVDKPEFTVDGSGGEGGTPGQGAVKFNKDFDYEAESSPSTTVKLTARLPCDDTMSDEADVIVILEDVNDNTPYFDSSLTIIQKPENAEDFLITTLKARDGDVTDLYNTTSIIFTLQNNFGGLIILGNTGYVDEWATVELLLTEPLDYEQAGCYQVNVIATDCKGTADSFCPSPLSTTAVVSIGVLDAPDQPPIFTEFTPNVEILEDSPIGTIVTSVTAVDGDKGLNKPISYSLQDGSGWYQIDTNGVITVKLLQDREDEHYDTEAGTKLIITAAETEDGESTTSITITVRLIDVNDMGPTFEHPSYTASVPETASVGYPVTLVEGLIEITDSDEIGNAAYDVSIKEADVPFRLSATEGVGTYLFAILVNDVLEYAATPECILTIEATDKLNRDLTSSSIVTITVLQIDRPPTMILAESSQCFSVPEMATKGTEVCQFKINYSDGSNNARIKYSLSQESTNGLNIDNSTGAVTIADGTIFDYESSKSYYVMVTATDNFHSSQNPFTFSLSGNITDINDNDPIFLPSPEGVIFNGDTEFVSPFTVQALDSDSGNNGVVSYKLTGHVNNEFFLIKTETKSNGQQVGVISPNGAIKTTSISGCNNQQDMCNLQLEVEATDSGSPPRKSVQIVTAKIMNCYCFKSSAAAHKFPMELYYFIAFYVLRMLV